ncbi:(d)CMP kinase [Fretibacterium sp. OH1220_COT-178]|uniref:(d)CMP kinase n=1 Tax=Fretibacterium sp. OH1220_COT-178 TaxID=2491047 RepID=UPI000F5EE79B|nr:(d)CMP kinase [Fretibacterium sp. OH1220_COT-178]RRD65645.1 (d)CMP kinase [Fretibacterium sp. OH1220_COT-178]
MAWVLTIDGPAGAGKSSVARRLARRLNVRYLDTGAIYRALALSLDRRGVAPAETEELRRALRTISVELRGERVLVNGEDVSDAIRTPHVDGIVSAYSALGCLREALLDLQRDQERYGPLVAEGRDVGSVVFPEAPLKFFMTASPEARARRRYLELQRRGEAVSFEDILSRIRERDRIDSSREIAPLRCPEGAVLVDTSDMTEDEVLEHLERHVRDVLERKRGAP